MIVTYKYKFYNSKHNRKLYELSHLEHVTPNCQMGMEEVEYLKNIASLLLEYQIATCEDEYEENYHSNCKKSSL